MCVCVCVQGRGRSAREREKEREWGVRTPTGTAPPSFIQRSGRLVEVVVRAPQPRQLETRVVALRSVSLCGLFGNLPSSSGKREVFLGRESRALAVECASNSSGLDTEGATQTPAYSPIYPPFEKRTTPGKFGVVLSLSLSVFRWREERAIRIASRESETFVLYPRGGGQ